jgi:hypothetical protein
MLSLPQAAEPLLSRFSIAFTRRTFQRAIVLLVGMLLCGGRHTVTGALRVIAHLPPRGHFSDYHRIFSRARWSLWPLGKVLATAMLALLPAQEPVICCVDDHCEEHRGKKVYGKGRHRDNCHATRTHKVFLWGHCWVVLCICVKFPFAWRPWALPVLFALYRTRQQNQQERRKHKTPLVLARQLMAVLLHWFPSRRFILCGDGHYAGHELARFCHLHRDRLTLVSLLHPRAHLCQQPAARRKGQMGRRRIRGQKLPCPQETVVTAKRHRSTVGWYGGKNRRVEFVTQRAHWYKATEGLVPIRWVFVHDLDGTHEDRYFYSTDPNLCASRIISLYTGRWSIEVTFQEARQHLGISSPRCWTPKSVLRTFPCLLGCFSVTSLLFYRQTRGRKVTATSWPWYHKSEVTFADAISSVRQMFWAETVFSEAYEHDAFKKVPLQLRQTLLHQLSLAA